MAVCSPTVHVFPCLVLVSENASLSGLIACMKVLFHGCVIVGVEV